MNRPTRNSVLFGIASVAFLCCSPEKEDQQKEVKAINTAYMDSTVRPQDDFFLFVNGNWIRETEIPGDQGRWGSFNELRETSNEAVLKVLDRASEDSEAYPEGSDQRKAIDYYSIGMDSLLAEERGIAPLDPWMEAINNIQDKLSLQEYLQWQQSFGGGAFFSFGVSTDAKNSEANALYVSQGGLGLPDRDYYVDKDNEKFQEIKAKYEKHISRMFQYLGWEEGDANTAASNILELETRLAQASKTRIEMRDAEARYNKFTSAELSQLTPSLDWKVFLREVGADTEEIIISTPPFMEALEGIIQTMPTQTWREYLQWKVINRAAPYLQHELVKADFDFYGRELQGTEEMRPRWKRVLASAEYAAGEAIGKLYTEEYFPQEAKDKALIMVDNILEAMGDRIQGLDWMTDETKNKAMEKLSTFSVKIGFPDEWKDYSGLIVDGNPKTTSYFDNYLQAARFRFEDNLKKLNQPVDRSEWFMNPQTVNAYYNPTWNEIVFPAAILQPPFFNYEADAAVNYGGIGAVIGHEISHGFDDQGSRYDAQGNLENWWQDEDLENFQKRTAKLVEQFDRYEPLEGVFVKGQLTLGENIGDLGGVLVAYDGLQKHLQQYGRPEKRNGFSQEQRFFISWATIWRGKSREEALRTQVQTDPHSPAQYRANGPLVNIDAFYEAFEVMEGDGMFVAPEDRVRIW
ncbi:M13 family metallopeptidase [Pleomorphovibrio marinus]|uniref:M13 family metallopeptidase n=1 Tax=Pleomorphovibrio marinus TaxID=2164132 RepID=UPI000E0CAE3F|nr:M13 family metallopeptidase [Pleomorphovibrio marinus]